MTNKELAELSELIDMPKVDLRLLVGSDHSRASRMDETSGWTRGELVVEAIERGLTSIRCNNLYDSNLD